MNKAFKYSGKVWLLSGAMSFLLCQLPLYYLYHNKFFLTGDSYFNLNQDIAIENIEAMCYLIIPWLVVLPFVKRLYNPVWTVRQFKWVVFLVSEFLIIFFLLDGISIFNTHLLLPTGFMLAIFCLSTAISIYVSSVDDILAELFRQIKDLE